MTTYRERRESRAAKLREWAEKRNAAAEAVHAEAEPFRGDIAYQTQPGHIPHRERLNARQEAAWRSQQKAARMEEKAGNIERATDRAIYDDDPDAVERLTERIAGFEAEREAIKRYNASCRKAQRNLRLLSEAQQRDLVATMRVMPTKDGSFPPFVLTNLSASINRLRKRLEGLT